MQPSGHRLAAPVATLSRTLSADPRHPTTLHPALPEGLLEAETAGLGSVESVARPQELYAIHALDALLRTATMIAPLDFAVITGDMADSNQSNEMEWFIGTLDGMPVHPDAGDANTQVDEDCNDPLAAFTPVGVQIPWYLVAGNHDVLVQGNFAPDTWKNQALGEDAPAGTRDLSLPGGPLSFLTVADAGRKLMERGDLAALSLDSPGLPAGHGFTSENVNEGSVHWVYDPAPGLRLIAVDANPSGPGDPQLSATERDQFLVPALKQAQADGRLIIVSSHYAAGELAVEGGGSLSDLLLQFPNVVLMVAGHYHVNRIRPYGAMDDPGAFWEILTDAVVDWPGQGRMVELVSNGDGTLSIFSTMLDYLAPEGSVDTLRDKLNGT